MPNIWSSIHNLSIHIVGRKDLLSTLNGPKMKSPSDLCTINSRIKRFFAGFSLKFLPRKSILRVNSCKAQSLLLKYKDGWRSRISLQPPIHSSAFCSFVSISFCFPSHSTFDFVDHLLIYFTSPLRHRLQSCSLHPFRFSLFSEQLP
jgi:hypothetical protein